MNTASSEPPQWRRRCILALLATVLVYVISYITNSAFGGYWLQPESDGSHRYRIGLSMPTAILWQPAYGHCARHNSDFLGVIFSPLVAFDRSWVHPTMDVTDDSTFEWISHKARPSHIHPRFRDEFINARKQDDRSALGTRGNRSDA